MNIPESAVGIHASVERYTDLVLTLMRGDFASGQRWIPVHSTTHPVTIETFATGQYADEL